MFERMGLFLAGARPCLAVVALCLLGACGRPPPNAPAPPATNAPTAATAAAESAVSAAFVIPGDYAQSTSLADFESRFGKANVQIVPEADDPKRRSVVLFPNDPARRAYVTFHDAEALTDLAAISVTDAGSMWRGKHGAHVGMSFAELRKLNGKPFYYFGFDSQRRAQVHDMWSPALDDDDGSLGAFDVEENEHMYFGVDLGFRDAASAAAAAYPVDDSVSSDDPRYPALAGLLVVTGIEATTSLDDEWE